MKKRLLFIIAMATTASAADAHVAGTLNVGNGQAAGAYTATYTVTVAYN